ncbi:Multiple inositol polyphosphate phosphatase 1 [Pseudolycoriella hygida]|uniref:Multiple inositol polyphosphate phosphatase 1 n=1 Tax=Pseudolycoriella hygida TaxID=35572 RepID=A0A9Q0N745_9DIPT|nr:Multiple inositol polyphosphate phosphatase 1 [Pseudolycoriella hygida]
MKFFVALLGVLAMAISADAGASMHNPFFCYATDTVRSMTNMGSVITSYEAIRRFNFTTVNPYMSTCTPSRFWYLGRYGSRLPHAPTLQSMIDFAESSIQDDIVRNYEAGRTTLCRQDFEMIRDFTLESDFGGIFRIENAGLLTESGIFALQNISRRYQEVFPEIFPQTYERSRFHFRHTGTPRTNVSIQAFATGLFGEVGAEGIVHEPIPEQDWFLRPFDFCPDFWEETADWDRQTRAFETGPEMLELIEQVNRKLGFNSQNELNFTQILTMWNWCRFKIAATFEASNSETGAHCPWCAPFSVAHHLLLEYYEDLSFFYASGYGVRNQRMLENLSCGLIQDLLNQMQSDNDGDTLARIFVSYSEEIQGMLVALGAFRDLWPIHQHNFAQQSGRHWLTSLISPFSANLAAVRYDCEDGDVDLRFFLNERPILVPGCDQQTGACKLSTIVDRFQRFISADCSTFFCSTN